MHTKPPDSPYTRRNIVIFGGARKNACANFGAIAQKNIVITALTFFNEFHNLVITTIFMKFVPDSRVVRVEA